MVCVGVAPRLSPEPFRFCYRHELSDICEKATSWNIMIAADVVMMVRKQSGDDIAVEWRRSLEDRRM